MGYPVRPGLSSIVPRRVMGYGRIYGSTNF